jgi:uncharacterized phage protein gp47/JayE
VTAIETEGADIESQDDFLSRVIQAYQTTPAGGSQPDYVDWALAVAGVTRAWCVPRGYGAGTVVVLFMMDSVRAAEEDFLRAPMAWRPVTRAMRQRLAINWWWPMLWPWSSRRILGFT